MKPVSMPPGLTLLINDSFGTHIPKHFAENFDPKLWHVNPSDIHCLLNDDAPENVLYYEVWDSVLCSAWMMNDGHKYTLHQDGDLWAVCPELMTNDEYENFYGEMKPAPDGVYEFMVCGDCLNALANDDYTGMDDEQEKATRNGLHHLAQTYKVISIDGAEYGFVGKPCECCDQLPGNRYRVFAEGAL